MSFSVLAESRSKSERGGRAIPNPLTTTKSAAFSLFLAHGLVLTQTKGAGVVCKDEHIAWRMDYKDAIG